MTEGAQRHQSISIRILNPQQEQRHFLVRTPSRSVQEGDHSLAHNLPTILHPKASLALAPQLCTVTEVQHQKSWTWTNALPPAVPRPVVVSYLTWGHLGAVLVRSSKDCRLVGCQANHDPHRLLQWSVRGLPVCSIVDREVPAGVPSFGVMMTTKLTRRI